MKEYLCYGASQDSELMNSDYISQYNVSATEIEDKTNDNFVSEIKKWAPYNYKSVRSLYGVNINRWR